METKPDPRMQRAVDMGGKQVLAALANEKGADMLARDAKQRGPDVAIAEAVQMAGQQVAKAAAGSGVELPPDVMQAIHESVAQVLVALMAESGLTDDPDATLQRVTEMLAPQQPQQPQGVLAQETMQ